MPSLETIGERVKQARLDAGLSYERLAADTEMSISHLHKIIGARSEASALEIWRIAHRTQKPFGWFAAETPTDAEDLLARIGRLHTQVQGLSGMMTDILAELRTVSDRAKGTYSRDETALPGSIQPARRR